MTPEILDTRTLHEYEHIQFLAKTVRLANGKIISKALIDHPGSVGIVPIADDGRVILIRQFRQAINDYILEIPAGTRLPDEDPRLCAERELQEEAGYFPGKLEAIGGFYLAPGHSNEYMHLFLARDLRPSRLKMDEDEIIETVPLGLDEALRMISTNEIRDGKTIIGLLRASAGAR